MLHDYYLVSYVCPHTDCLGNVSPDFRNSLVKDMSPPQWIRETKRIVGIGVLVNFWKITEEVYNSYPVRMIEEADAEFSDDSALIAGD